MKILNVDHVKHFAHYFMHFFLNYFVHYVGVDSDGSCVDNDVLKNEICSIIPSVDLKTAINRYA